MKKNVSFLGLVVCLAIMIAGCSENASEEVEEKREIPVEATSVEYGSLSGDNMLAGTIIPSDEADIKPKANAEIKSISVEKGDNVKKGQTLARLDDFEERNELEQQQVSLKQSQSELQDAKNGQSKAKMNVEDAKTSLDQAKASLEEQKKTKNDNLDDSDFQIESAKTALKQSEDSLARVEELYEEGLTSEENYDEALNAVEDAKQSLDKAKSDKNQVDSDVGLKSLESSVDQARIGVRIAETSTTEAEIGVDQAQASVDQAELGVEAAEEGLNNKTITAPFSGQVMEVEAETGEMASPQEPFANIVAVDQVKASVNVLPEVLETFEKGDTVDVQVDRMEDTITGEISYISPLSSDSGLFTVEANLENTERKVRPGMIASFVLDEELAVDSILVPTESIVQQEGLDVVYIVEDGTAIQREVEINHFDTDTTAVTSELEEDEQVITSGQNLLEDGDKVTVMEEE